MKIFLAGKVDTDSGAWRDGIVGKSWSEAFQDHVPRWQLYFSKHDFDDHREISSGSWPVSVNRFVLGLHEYVGPYRTTYIGVDSKYSGFAHGNERPGGHGVLDSGEQVHIVRECHQAIERSDMVFAYINTPDCFGTLAEIGLAVAMGKYVHVAVNASAQWEGDDYWYPELLADSRTSIYRWSSKYFDEDGQPKMSDAEMAEDALRDGLVRWTASERKPMRGSTHLRVVSGDAGAWYAEALVLLNAITHYSQSVNQIIHWTSDPRVRNEATRVATHMQRVLDARADNVAVARAALSNGT